MLGRIEVQPDDVFELVDEAGVVGEFERLDTVWLESVILQVQPGSLPGVAPGVARDLVLDWQGKVGRGAERVGNEVFAHDLFTGGQAFVKLSIHVRVLLKKL